MTTQLFYQSIHITEFTASVLSMEPNGDLYDVVLDQTAFFPTGGGMEFDQGTLNDLKVVNVIKRDEVIVHQLREPIEGATVFGKIDIQDRTRRIQIHDAQHLVSGLFEKHYNAATVSHHVYKHYCDLDLECSEMTQEMVDRIEQMSNQLIFEKKNIETLLVPKSELSRYGIEDSPLYSDPVRLVNIESVDDMNACGCLHFDNLSFVQAVKLLSFEKTSRGFRLYFTAGGDLIDYFQSTLRLQQQICQLTTSNESTVLADLSGVIAKNQLMTEWNGELLHQLMKFELQELVKQKDHNDFVVYESNRYTLAEMKKLALLVNKYEAPLLALLQVSQDDTFQFILCKSSVTDIDLVQIFEKLKTEYNAVGGGRGLSINGKSPVNLAAIKIELG